MANLGVGHRAMRVAEPSSQLPCHYVPAQPRLTEQKSGTHGKWGGGGPTGTPGPTCACTLLSTWASPEHPWHQGHPHVRCFVAVGTRTPSSREGSMGVLLLGWLNPRGRQSLGWHEVLSKPRGPWGCALSRNPEYQAKLGREITGPDATSLLSPPGPTNCQDTS